MARSPIDPVLATICKRLKKAYPEARYELNWGNPFQLLIATILAAQATDARINQLTPGLFAKYPNAEAFAAADRAELEQDLRPSGFFRNKARAVQECCRALVERFQGEVPPRMEDLVTLPGVARKTANVVLNMAFHLPSGIMVDTHVIRVSQRLGLTRQTKPEKIEQELMSSIPRKEWIRFGAALVLLGRYVCVARKPQCRQCLLGDLCPRRGVKENKKGQGTLS
jgi:endonuclease-3